MVHFVLQNEHNLKCSQALKGGPIGSSIENEGGTLVERGFPYKERARSSFAFDKSSREILFL